MCLSTFECAWLCVPTKINVCMLHIRMGGVESMHGYWLWIAAKWVKFAVCNIKKNIFWLAEYLADDR